MSGVPGPLRQGIEGDCDGRLLLLPRDGVACSEGGGNGSCERTAGDKGILVPGDIGSDISLIGLFMTSHEPLGMRIAG
jgi:hypothetical protein